MKNKTRPIRKKEEIKQNPDNKIDEDFAGYPHASSKNEIIKPGTIRQKEVSDLANNNIEKRIYRKDETDEQDSDGSANAFEGK